MIDTELKWDVGLKMAAQNLRFNDVFFVAAFSKLKKQKMHSHFYEVVDAFGKVWENSKKSWKQPSFCSCSTAFLALWSFHSLFYSTIRRWLRDFYSAVVEEGAARVREQFNCVGQRDQSTSRSTLYLNPPDRQCENAKSGRPFVIKRTLRAT